eukprot:1951205-Pyramimonas_sp.AAC.1
MLLRDTLYTLTYGPPLPLPQESVAPVVDVYARMLKLEIRECWAAESTRQVRVTALLCHRATVSL